MAAPPIHRLGVAGQMSERHWLQQTKVPTLQALKQRLTNHDKDIRGKCDPDVEVGFCALVDRVSDTISTFKALKKWCDNLDDALLVAVWAHLEPLEAFIHHTGKELSPEMWVLAWHCRAQVAVRDKRSLADVLDKIPIDTWVGMATEVHHSGPYTGPKEKDGRQTEDGLSPQSADDLKTLLRKAKHRRYVGCDTDVSEKLNMKLSAKRQIGLMVLGALKKSFASMGPIHENADTVTQLVFELNAIGLKLSDKTRDLDGDSMCSSLIASVAVIFSCCLPPAQRPISSVVLEARKMVTDVAASTEPEAAFGKAVILYEHCKPFMAASQTHASVGLQDDSATTQYNMATDQFEESLATALDDIDAYFGGADDGSIEPLTIEAYKQDTKGFLQRCGTTLACVARWGPRTLEQKGSVVAEDLSSMTAVVSIGMVLLVQKVYDVVNNLDGLVPAPLDTDGKGTDVALAALEDAVTQGIDDVGCADSSAPVIEDFSGDDPAPAQSFIPSTAAAKEFNDFKDTLQGYLVSVTNVYKVLGERLGEGWARSQGFDTTEPATL
jgi:hypothetical protein